MNHVQKKNEDPGAFQQEFFCVDLAGVGAASWDLLKSMINETVRNSEVKIPYISTLNNKE